MKSFCPKHRLKRIGLYIRQLSDMRVMIVEDEAILALALMRYLESIGHDVVAHCYSGEDALEKLSETLPDIVLMDLSLQGEISGLDAGKAVIERKIPLVIVSAHTDRETLDGIAGIGCRYHLAKPLNYRQLDEMMNAAIS